MVEWLVRLRERSRGAAATTRSGDGSVYGGRAGGRLNLRPIATSSNGRAARSGDAGLSASCGGLGLFEGRACRAASGCRSGRSREAVGIYGRAAGAPRSCCVDGAKSDQVRRLYLGRRSSATP